MGGRGVPWLARPACKRRDNVFTVMRFDYGVLRLANLEWHPETANLADATAQRQRFTPGSGRSRPDGGAIWWVGARRY